MASVCKDTVWSQPIALTGVSYQALLPRSRYGEHWGPVLLQCSNTSRGRRRRYINCGYFSRYPQTCCKIPHGRGFPSTEGEEFCSLEEAGGVREVNEGLAAPPHSFWSAAGSLLVQILIRTSHLKCKTETSPDADCWWKHKTWHPHYLSGWSRWLLTALVPVLDSPFMSDFLAGLVLYSWTDTHMWEHPRVKAGGIGHAECH